MLSCCPERKQAPSINVELLVKYVCEHFSTLVFKDGGSLRVKPGTYYTSLGSVIDLEAMTCKKVEKQ